MDQQLVVQAQDNPGTKVSGGEPHGGRPSLEELCSRTLDHSVAGESPPARDHRR